MTSIGIQYLNLNELRRSNLAQERIKQQTLDETVRSNKAQENLKQQTIEETIRANKASEAIRNESNRLQSLSIDEVMRHNMVSETETATHNRVVEGNTRYNTNLNSLSDSVKDITAMKDMGIANVANRLSGATSQILQQVFGNRGILNAIKGFK